MTRATRSHAVGTSPGGSLPPRTCHQRGHEVRLLAGRSLRHIPRIPEKLFGGLLMPIVFVLLFAYVFGSAIDVPGGGDYHEYLVSGIFAQSMIGTLPGISVGVASDIRSRA